MPKPVRRVVTGLDSAGMAVALFDGASPHVLEHPGYASATMLWRTAEMPARNETQDRAADQTGILAPARGTVIRMVEFPPHDERAMAGRSHRDVFRGLVAPDETLGPARHAHMHCTETVDYGIVVEGEIDMLLDDSEVHLRAGDVMIQQATNHAWVNRGTSPCRICFVLINGAKGARATAGAWTRAASTATGRSRPVRRIVTGHDAGARAVILADGPNPNVHERERSVAHNLWRTLATPATYAATDPFPGHRGTPPPANGTLLRITEIPPDGDLSRYDHDAFARELGIEPLRIKGQKPRHPFMHRTATVDYGIVLAGELDMLLDETEVHLSAGDVVVQQATNHAWSNRSGRPCRIAFVLIDGVKP
jgi:naringenin degradation protein FdeH